MNFYKFPRISNFNTMYFNVFQRISKYFQRKSFAFTLVELLIVIGITATLSVIGVSFYASQQKAKILENTAQEIANYLRYTQQKSVSQEQSLQWGIHFENSSSDSDFYALYTGTTYTTPVETKYLPAGIEFQTPTSGNSVNISFSKLTGLNYSGTEQELIIRLTSNQIARSIRTTLNGLVTISEGEKGYWKFDEGSGTTAYDSTIYKNTGILTNSPTWQTESNCVSGSCLGFNGSNNYVDAGNDSSLNPTNAITVSYWIKTTSTVGEMPISKGVWNEYYSYNYSSGGTTSFRVYTSAGNLEQYSSFNKFNDGNWHLFTATWDNSDGHMRIYVNGQLDVTSSGTLSGTINAQTNHLYIGCGKDVSSYYYNGLIDEVRIYNRVLSPAEIQQHYNSRS